MLDYICEYCNKLYTMKVGKGNCCSRSCIASLTNKRRWENLEYREKYLKTVSDQNYKDKISERSKEMWKNPTHKERVVSAWRKSFEKNNTSKKISDNSKRMWEDPNFKESTSKKIKDALNMPDKLEWRKQLMLDKWSNSESADIWLKSCFTYKDFILPSGKVVKLQGYEPYVLAELLLTYNEDDILICRCNIESVTGKIKYEQFGVSHSYFPDFYIISINTIIEVKSTYTFNKHKEKNLLKEAACKNLGFNFKFIIYEKS